MSSEFISKEEMTKSRTPFELMDWEKQKRRNIASTPEGESALMLNKGLAKQFNEEIYPLAIFGCRKFGNTKQILLQPIIGSQNYDAVVTDLSSKPASQSYIEITQAHEGIGEYLLRCALDKQRIVMRGPFKVDVVACEELERIVEAAKRKKAKDYPKDTSLIIVFKDGGFFRPSVNDKYLDTFVKKNIMKLDLRFSTLYIIGWYDVFREFNLDKRT